MKPEIIIKIPIVGNTKGIDLAAETSNSPEPINDDNFVNDDYEFEDDAPSPPTLDEIGLDEQASGSDVPAPVEDNSEDDFLTETAPPVADSNQEALENEGPSPTNEDEDGEVYNAAPPPEEDVKEKPKASKKVGAKKAR